MSQVHTINARDSRLRRPLSIAARLAFAMAAAVFYVAAATEHAMSVNLSKARGDQSAVLQYAKNLHANWHGQEPPTLGDRNRMPLYPAFQALFYDPAVSDAEFFVVAKRRSIWLSLVLVLLLGAIFRWCLPSLPAANLTLVVAFGYFVFKAGYVQPELLFYFLFFVTFLASCYLLRARRARMRIVLAALAGTLAALAHLTKAAMLPYMVILLAVGSAAEMLRVTRGWRDRASPWPASMRQAALGALTYGVVAGCFLGVLYPYISNSKRVFGQYFYNVNSTFYVWYDHWSEAATGTRMHDDRVGWPMLPAGRLPSLRKYLRTHSIGQIAVRFRDGFLDMLTRSYNDYWFLKFVVMYVVLAGFLVASNGAAFGQLVRAHPAVCAFLLLYGVAYLLLTAFFHPVSGTGTARYLLSHVAPLMFTLSCLFVRSPFRDTTWSVAGVTFTVAHFHWLVSITLVLDIAFTVWARLMTTYGGF